MDQESRAVDLRVGSFVGVPKGSPFDTPDAMASVTTSARDYLSVCPDGLHRKKTSLGSGRVYADVYALTSAHPVYVLIASRFIWTPTVLP